MVKLPSKSTAKGVEKTRKAPKPAPTKSSHKSQEFVVDSGDEDAAPEDRSVKKVNTVVTPVAAPKSHKNPPAAVEDDESEEDDEASEDDDEDELPANPVPKRPNKDPPKVNGVKRKVEETKTAPEDSEDESEEEEDSDEPDAKRAKASLPAVEESDESEDGEDELEDQNADEGAKGPQPASAPELASVNAVTAPSDPIPPQPFRPPPGFTLVNTEATSASLSKASLAGKQIWHMIAPSDVPLSTITQVAMDAIRSGQPLLTHNGAEYVLNDDTTSGANGTVFLPDKDGYKAVRHKVEKTLRLQQKITLPNLSIRQASQTTGSAAAADVAQASVTTIRPQPKGLRMRYKPPGFGPGTPGVVGSGSDSGDEEAPGAKPTQASFQFPRTLGAHSTEQHAEGGAEETAVTKKPKKKRKEKQHDPAADSSLTNGSPVISKPAAESAHQQGTASTIAATPVKKVVLPEIADVSMTNGVTPEPLSKEEKARRKEEKRLKKERKEAKLKAKQAAA